MSRNSFIETIVGATRIGFPLASIERVVRAVALHAVPSSGGCLLGAMDLGGEMVTVYDMRKLLGLPSRPMRCSDRILIASVPSRCGLVVDDVLGAVAAPALELTNTFALHAVGIRGMARGPEGVLLVQDLRRLLALERAVPVMAAASGA